MTKHLFKPALLALAVSLVAACGQADKNEVPQAVASQQQLASGVETANFDAAVAHSHDFYHSVNGTWLAKTPIPADKSNYGAFSQLADEAELNLKAILEEAAAAKAEPGSEQAKLAAFWTAYMDEAAIEAHGLAPLKSQLDAIAAATTHDALAAVMGQLLTDGVEMPWMYYVNNDAKKSDQYAVYLYQAGLGLPDRDYYLADNPKFVALRGEYKAFIADYLGMAEVADSAKVAEAVYAIEAKLAEAQWSRVDSRDADKTYNAKSAADMVTLLDGFSWQAFAGTSGLAKSDKLIVAQPSYLEAFGNFFTAVPVADWQAYLQLRLLSNYAGYLPKSFDERHFAFFGKALRGVEEQPARWKRAVAAADQQVGELLGKIYVERHFQPEAKARMEQLVANLIKAYEISINELEWMSAETKVKAQQKLAKFTPKIGYPSKWKDYSALEIKADDLAGNYRRAANWEYARMLAKLGQPIDRSEWFMTPQTVNAYYSPTGNEIVFPAAILQPPFFNVDADDAVNYGAIGAVIGHEISHGFDDQGSKYDGDGNLSNWWTDADLSAFDARGKQLVEQYNQYSPLPGMHVNGELTLGENIADLGGLTVALEAYRLSLAGGEAPVIDGMTGTQRFFYGWSQVWRRNYREEDLRSRLVVGPHSPNQYRVIGIVANMPEYYEAFGVKEGDAMYIAPEKRVKIW